MAVLAVFLDDKDNIENPEFQKILQMTPASGGTHDTTSGVHLDIMALLPEDKKHVFTYAGLLTTPPGSEGVNWYVLSVPFKVSTAQITQLQSICNNSNRQTQHLNGRTVEIVVH